MGSYALAIVLAGCTLLPAFGQCPPDDPPGGESEVCTLEGQLVFHDAIRKWFELKLDQPRCGQASFQLVGGEREMASLEVLRGCRVKSRGALGYSPTGYYSLDMYQGVGVIEPVGACTRQSRLPDFSDAEPDKTIRKYRVEMHVNYAPGDHPIVFRVTSDGKELRPWQAYASYSLTGGFVLYGSCGNGFVVDKVFGTPKARPSHFDASLTSADRAAFDPESAAAAGKTDLRLGFTCVREK